MVLNVQWDGNDGLVADTPFHCTVPMTVNDETLAAGKLPSPIDLFVASLGGCPLHGILALMQEQKITLTRLSAKVEGTRRGTLPTTFEKIHVTFTLSGDVDDRTAGAIINEVMTLHCPVAVSFSKATRLTWSHRIVP